METPEEESRPSSEEPVPPDERKAPKATKGTSARKKRLSTDEKDRTPTAPKGPSPKETGRKGGERIGSGARDSLDSIVGKRDYQMSLRNRWPDPDARSH